MAVSKTRKFARKAPKRYNMVTFETDVFDGAFTFPSMKNLPIKVIEALNTGEMQIVSQWLLEAGADKDAVDAYRELDQEEMQGFIDAWGKGELADLPKSGS